MLSLQRPDGSTAANIEPADGITDDDLQAFLTDSPDAVTVTDESAPAVAQETLADRLLTRYAQFIEAGDIPDLEAARQVLNHPLFGRTINNVEPHEDFRALEDLNRRLDELDAAPLADLNPKIAEADRKVEQLTNEIDLLQRKLSTAKKTAEELRETAHKHTLLSDFLPITFRMHTAFAYIPSLTARIKARGFRVPAKPNYR